MSVRAALAAALLAACASAPPPLPEPESTVHPRFAVLRPAMVALEAPEDLREPLYRGLIDRGYSVLVEGAPAGPETGTVRAAREGPGATLVFSDPFGTEIYRASVTVAAAAALLRDLPRK